MPMYITHPPPKCWLPAPCRRVFYVPGNHCLWLRGQEAQLYGDSFAKWLVLRKVMMRGLGTWAAQRSSHAAFLHPKIGCGQGYL